MADLNIKAFFSKISGDDNLVDKSDVTAGRIDKNIAKELGIIDENGNYTDKTYTQEQFESGIDINKLLKAAHKKSDNIRASKENTERKRVNENGSKAISQEKINLKGRDGILIKYEDGSVEFDASAGRSIFKLKFKNESDYKSKKAYQLTEGPKFGDKEFTRTTTYEYYENGKLKSEKQVLDETGAVLKTGEYDKRGGLNSQKKYNKDGKLLESSEGKWEDDNTHVIVVKDENNNLKQKIVDKLNNGKMETRNIYNKNDILTEENFYTDNKLSKKRLYYPDSGKLRTEAEFFAGGGYKSIKTYDKNGKELQNYIADMIPDGKTWDKSAAQVGEGDCYLVASVNAIRKLSDGDKMLSNLIDIKTDSNGKKTYTVTLPGALIAAEGLSKDSKIKPGKMYITGTYTFTEEEFDKIAHKQGSKYSIGNANIVLLEAAFEKFREEVLKTVKANNINPQKNVIIPGLFTTGNGLAGGVAYDAVFMLTGKPSKVYENNNPDYSLEKQALQNNQIRLVSNNKEGIMQKAAPSSVEEMTNEKSRLNNMLNEIMTDLKDGKKDIIATAGFRIYNAETQKTSGHALTIVDVTEKTVTITNPWYPDRTLTMTREDFLASADMVTICDASKNTKIKQQEIQVQPDQRQPKTENKPDNNPSERPVTEKDKEEMKNLVNRFYKGNKPSGSGNTKLSKKAKKVFDIMNSELKRNNPSEPDKKAEKKEQTQNPRKQELTIEQLKEIIKKTQKNNI